MLESALLTAVPALVLVLAAAISAPWKTLQSNERSHVWWGAILVVTLAWMMRPELAAGLRLHFLGATVLVLMFGARLAFVGLAVASGVATLAGAAPWRDYSHALLAGGLVPVLVSAAIQRATERWLPAHVFVYIFVAAFLSGGVATFTSDAVSLFTAPDLGPLAGEPGVLGIMALLLAFAEATLTGMVISILVAYRPGWLSRFDDRRYLARRP